MKNFMDVSVKVKKPVEAIQCANTFSLLQRKMYNVLLANAAGNLHQAATHRITMGTLCGLMGYCSNDYKTIKLKFRELRRMDMEWDIINENGNKVWTNTSPLSLARVIEGEGICEYEFTPSLIPYLDRPAQYAKFSLAIQSKFKSGYGLALYENCERYRNIGCTRAFDIPTFRKLMGVSETEYIDFFALKRRVVKKAVDEVNLYADFGVEPEYLKQGRSVVSIRFIIANKSSNQKEAVLSPTMETQSPLANLLREYFGVHEKDIAQFIKKYGAVYVEEKATGIINSDSFKNGQIKNMAGYLKSALADNYQSSLSSRDLVSKKKIEQAAKLRPKQELEEKTKESYKQYETDCVKQLINHLQNITQKEKETIDAEFETFLGTGLFVSVFRKEGLNNFLIADRFLDFVKRVRTDLLSHMLTFEEFLISKDQVM